MDIGRSSSAHERERFYSDGHVALLNWGNWWRCLPRMNLDYPPQPMFREYRSGYPVTRGLPPAYDEDKAMLLDRKLARCLSEREVNVLLCEYVFKMPTRTAARYLTKKGARCTHTKYSAWLDAAVGRVDMLVS